MRTTSRNSHRKAGALIVCGALAVLGAVLFVLSDGAAGAPPPTAGSMAEDGGDDGPAATRTARRDDGQDDDALLADDEIERAELDVAAVADGDGPLLRVVEAATERPIARAEVFFADDRAARIDWRDRERTHWSDQLVATGTRLLTDSDGTVALPPVQRRTLVVARTDELYGVGTIDRGATESVLRLEVDRSVTVRVVDGGGTPLADVDVVLAVHQVRQVEPRARATTDADGIAVLPHLQLHRGRVPTVDPTLVAQYEALRGRVVVLDQQLRVDAARRAPRSEELRGELRSAQQLLREFERGARERLRGAAEANGGDLPTEWADFVVAARMPALGPSTLRFGADAIPTGIVELRLGATGAVVVELVGPDGAPLWSPCAVELRRSGANPLPAGVDPALADGLARLSVQRADKPAGVDRVRFAPVGADTLLDVAVRFPDNDFSFEQRDLAGPVGGEERTLRVTAPDWFAVLSGRLVGRDGQPWRELRAELLLSGRAGRVEGEPITTDDDGRFELPVRLREPTPPYVLEVQARRGRAPVGALLEVRSVETGRRHELGDIVVDALPVLASGTIRDDRGEPIRGADLRLQTFAPGAGERGAWQDVAYVGARSAEDGTFELFGEPRDAPMRVRARQRGHANTDSGTIPFGATVALSMTRLGGIVATGHAPEWLSRDAVEVVLMRDARRVRAERLRARRDGSFRIALRDVEPGVYDLALVLRGIGNVASQPAVTVAPGESTTLPEIDLRDTVFRYEVHAVDQAGQTIGDPGSPLLAQVVDPERGPRWVAFPWRGERAEFYSTGRAATVVVLASGHRPARAEIAPGATTLSLVRLNPIEVAVPGLRGLVGERRVRLSLVFEGDTGLPMADLEALDQVRGNQRGYQRAALGKSSGAWLPPDGDVVRMNLMLNGRYQLVARISEPGQRRQVSKVLGTVEAVVDAPEVRRVTVAPPPAIVQQALAELAAR